MARVVQQRTTPPYLLIVFVFLFLLSTALAVLFYLGKDKSEKDLAQVNSQLSRLASVDQLNRAPLQGLMEEAAKDSRNTVSQMYQGWLNELGKKLTDGQLPAQDLLTQCDEVCKKTGSSNGILKQLSSACDELTAKNSQIQDLSRQLEAKNKELQEQKASSDTAAAELNKKIEALNATISNNDAALAKAHSEYNKQVEQLKADWEKKRGELELNIASKMKDIQAMTDQTNSLRKQIDRLMEDRNKAGGKGGDPMEIARRGDGKVLRMSDDGRLVYISIGAREKVNPGVTFTVYPASGVTTTGEGKGTITVTNVFENTAEARITGESEPIIVGDQVANLAFDADRQYTFVVEGVFDLYGTGQPTAAGAEEVKMLIKKYGGKVAEEVNFDTDFVVIGQKPASIPKPSESAGQQAYQVWKDQMKQIDHFDVVVNGARGLHIPTLNEKRFLAFIGQTARR